jgi:hypothetical protein
VLARKPYNGRVLSGVKWGFTVGAGGTMTSTTTTPLTAVTNYRDFYDAVRFWNLQADGVLTPKNNPNQVGFGDLLGPIGI